MPDLTKNCLDCKSPFVITEGEQAWYAEKGWTPPLRCKECRDKRKAEKDARGATKARA